MPCSNCGNDNPAGARFCNQCGMSLEPVSVFGKQTEVRTPGLTGERRHLTVLFCDLVGSTSIAAQLDPEEWREIVANYHRLAAQAIERFGGHVAQYLGDGVMAYFGWPEAHDNAAESAARAGLEIVEQIPKLNRQPAHAMLATRVGIDSGPVVIGAGAGKDADVFGDAPNIAARTQAAAEPDTVVVTGATQRLISGLFVMEDRGAQSLKGIERPVQLHRLIRPSGARGRLEAIAAGRGLTRFIGREDELRLLMERWELVRRGEGQVITIIGEAGVGKSRLVRRFHEQIAANHIWVEAGAQRSFQNTPFYQVGDLVKQFLTLNKANTPEANLPRLERALESSGLKLAEAIPLIAPLLNLALPPKYPPLVISSEERRRRLLATLVEWVVGAARLWRSPLAVVTEDLQWADPSTLEAFARLVQEQLNSRLLLLYTARPEFRAPWPLRPHHTHVALHPLSASSTRSMMAEIMAYNALSDETIDTVIQRSGGVPLFVEELTRAVLEAESGHLKTSDIPVTLHDSLMVRLDRLGPARETIQLGAVLGTEFAYEFLLAVTPLNEDELQRHLRALTDSELLYELGLPPNVSYQFKHALIRDAAYEALLKTRRRELHSRIAQIIKERFPDQAASRPEILAYHCTEAGLIPQAVRYWRRAGQKASERSANVEAIAQLRKGLELLNALPLTSERLIEEVKLQIALTTPLIATAGYIAPEVEKASSRALELCRQLGETPQLFVALGSLESIYFKRGELEIALELSKQLLHLAETQQDAVLLLWAHYAMGFSLAWRGELKSARDHLERSIALYDRRRAGTYGFVQDPGPSAMAQLSHVVHSLGYPQQALARMRDGVAQARNLSHPFTVALVLGYAASLHWRRGEKSIAQELWREEAALSSEQGFKALLAAASLRIGFSQVQEGRAEDGLVKMYEAVTSLTDSLVIDIPYGLVFLALALGKVRQLDQGLARIDEALALAKKTPKFLDLPLLYVTKGQLLLMKSPSGLRKAKQFFSKAIEIARDQSAKSDELAATIQIAKLLVRSRHREQARALLRKIYNWFTEGFDTADLKEAKALLEELSR
jgi:class 3 adenylate cyclase/tetratricopeptide (TPR) repeat protein